MAALEQIAKQWYDAFNKKDLKALMALYADDCVNMQPHVPHPIRGKKATEEDINGFLTAFPDAQLQPTSMVVSGDTVAAEWKFTGTQTGPLAGPMGMMPPSNKKVSMTGAEFTQHNAQGLIVSERGYFDVASFMMQLGVMPAPQP